MKVDKHGTSHSFPLMQELIAIGDTVGVVSKGLMPEAIQQLPQARYVHPSERESDVRRIKGALHLCLSCG